MGAVLTSILTFNIQLLFSSSHFVPTSSHIPEVTVFVITHLSQPQMVTCFSHFQRRAAPFAAAVDIENADSHAASHYLYLRI